MGKNQNRRSGWEPFVHQTIELDAAHGYGRRCNLLETLTVFLQIKSRGKFEILSRGTEARFRIEPFLLTTPPKYEPPPFVPGGGDWDLDAGFYVLTVEPVQKGILDMVIRPAGLLSYVLDLVGVSAEKTTPVRAAVTFPEVSLNLDSRYTLYLNAQPGVKAGVVLRPLPLDLTDPLSVTQRPGETVTVPIQVKEDGTLRARAEDGSLLELLLDGGSWQKSVAVTAGAHVVSVRTGGADTVIYSLALDPPRLDAATPLPALPDTALAALPKFPVLAEGSPQFFDLEREASATFLVRAEAPGLYRLQSTGLLSTEGNLRTRTVTSLDRESENGVGRNFLIQSYLREGDYQLTVRARGKSAGHLGLKLERTELTDAGALEEGLPARMALASGEAASYQFTPADKGDYRVRAIGLGRGFNGRLEEGDGWPVARPSAPADFALKADGKGKSYRLMLLPEPLPTRRVTLLEKVREPLRVSGHGPHRLPLETLVEATWLEPDKGGPRPGRLGVRDLGTGSRDRPAHR